MTEPVDLNIFEEDVVDIEEEIAKADFTDSVIAEEIDFDSLPGELRDDYDSHFGSL